MPLKKGKSRQIIGSNIKEMVHDWEKDGTIGNSKPDTKKKAVKQATAIALKKAGKSKYQSSSKARRKGKSKAA